MPAPAYTESEAALHELGHAMVACALGLPFHYVEIRPAKAPRTGWEGQCLLVNEPRRVAMDAFSLGGPLLQILMEPQSMGGHVPLFQPSLFSNHARCMDKNDALPIASELGWTDLYVTGMMHHMDNWPQYLMQMMFRGQKPWLPHLEDHVRAFLSLPQVQEVATELRPKLVQAVRLDSLPVIDAFNAIVDLADCATLVAYLAAQPD